MINELSLTEPDLQGLLPLLQTQAREALRYLHADRPRRTRRRRRGDVRRMLSAAVFQLPVPLPVFGRANNPSEVGAVRGAETARDYATRHYWNGADRGAAFDQLRPSVVLRLNAGMVPSFDARLPAGAEPPHPLTRR